jgi:hypothetical protein
MPAWRLLAIPCLVVLAACEPPAPGERPDAAVREFVEAMRNFHGDETEAEALFHLLSDRAKQNLRLRAERYGAASGKTAPPWAMIVPSRTTPRFNPHAYSAQIAGKYALVEIAGVLPTQRAQIPCVLEDGLWRVDLVLPELAPLPKRESLDQGT